jgi:hypothetical protein
MIQPDEDLTYLSTVKDNLVLVINHISTYEYAENTAKMIRPRVIIHLSDEHGNRPEWLGLANWTPLLLRQHHFPHYPNSQFTNVMQIPLGYITGMLRGFSSLDLVNKPLEQRAYAWSFVGAEKSDRSYMLTLFRRYFPKHYCKTSDQFEPNEVHAVDPSRMCEIYQDSIFVPNGRGWVSLDCFRLYEAAICGAIPVVVGSEDEIAGTFRYNGIMPPFIFERTWEDAARTCNQLLLHPDKLYKTQGAILQWWRETMATIHSNIANVIV